MTATHSEPLWTRAFVLLCAVQFLGSAQHFVLQPTIPIYVTHLGASPFAVGFSLEALALCVVVNASTLAGMTIQRLFTTKDTKSTKKEFMTQRCIRSHRPISELCVLRALRGENLIRIRAR